MSTMIKSLDDIALVPTPVTMSVWTPTGRVDRAKERMQARILAEAEGQTVTAVLSNLNAEPYAVVGQLTSAHVVPRAAGGYSPWELTLLLTPKGKRNPIGYSRDFPAMPVIIMRGAHALDFAEIIRTPMQGQEDHRFRDESYSPLWLLVSSYCAEVAGDQVMLDTTGEAIRFQHGWWKERKLAVETALR
jgi:hypothetical protein